MLTRQLHAHTHTVGAELALRGPWRHGHPDVPKDGEQ